MYEFIILAQLMHGPAHGYLIAKIINDMIGPYARISYGRLYPLLAKLEQNGLIAPEHGDTGGQQRDRQQRIYAITDAGRARFHLLMSDMNSNPGEYQKLFAYKVTAFGYITPVERLRLIDHYIHYCQVHMFHQQAEAEDLVRQAAEMDDMYRDTPQVTRGFPRLSSDSIERIVNTMQHSIEQWQHERDWAKRLREREITLATESGRGVQVVGAQFIAPSRDELAIDKS